jgi:hypothetical protein
LISYEKKYFTTTFIQLLRTKIIKNKIKTNRVKNIMKKEEKSYLNVVVSEAKEREKNS